MKTKIMLLALCLCTVVTISFGQKNLAEVNKIKGFYVFVDSKPVGEYEALGEVVSDDNKDPEIRKSGAQYESVRDNLIKNARAANYTADGIILKFVNGGVDKAEIIKFKENDKNKSKAKVYQTQGIYVFVDSEPITESSYVGTAKKGDGGGWSSPQYTALRDGLIKKCKKDFKDKEFDAIIIKFVEGGANTADAVKLK